MSQENLEKRIADLEKSVIGQGASIVKLGKDSLEMTDKIVQDRMNIGALIEIILSLHPELRTSRTAFSLHSTDTALEIFQESLAELKKRAEQIKLPGEPPPPPPPGN